MRETELMINDWVCDGRPKRIEAIIGLRAEVDGGEIASVGNLRGIEITPDILNENGIELLEVGDNGAATPPHLRNRYEKWFIHTSWQDSLLWFDRRTKKWHLGDMNAAQFVHVHELQHALRMIGMSDLADSLKL